MSDDALRVPVPAEGCGGLLRYVRASQRLAASEPIVVVPQVFSQLKTCRTKAGRSSEDVDLGVDFDGRL